MVQNFHAVTNVTQRHLRLAFSMDSGDDVLLTPYRGMWDSKFAWYVRSDKSQFAM